MKLTINDIINMNYIKTRLAICILFTLFFTLQCIHVSFTHKNEHNKVSGINPVTEHIVMKQNYLWLPVNHIYTQGVFQILKKYTIRKRIDIALFCSLIQYESGNACNNDYEWMTRVHSRSNAIGLCQMLAKYHAPGGDHTKLYSPELNIKLGTNYYRGCLDKAYKEGWKNPIVEANRMYNQGRNGKRWRYSNWKHYAYPIYRKYNKVRRELIWK